MSTSDTHTTHWFALKVFFNRVPHVRKSMEDAGHETYVPMTVVETFEDGGLRYVDRPLVTSLLFVHCAEQELIDFKKAEDKYFMYYSDFLSGRPARISDKEMRNFILATSVRDRGLQYMGEDSPEFHEGQHVRVKDGIYKGVEGYIKRIKRDRKFFVCLSGVAVVCTSFIHPSFLEPIDD